MRIFAASRQLVFMAYPDPNAHTAVVRAGKVYCHGLLDLICRCEAERSWSLRATASSLCSCSICPAWEMRLSRSGGVFRGGMGSMLRYGAFLLFS